MHPIYTEIPQRSYDALVRNGTLKEIMLALMVDPLESADVADQLERDPTKSMPIGVGDFADLGANVIATWRITVAQWVKMQAGACPALRGLLKYDQRLGVWCACQSVREALHLVRTGNDLPRRAIETAEAWVMGKATAEQVRLSSRAAYVPPDGTRNAANANDSVSRAAAFAALAAYSHRNNAAGHAASAASIVASAFADPEGRSSRWKETAQTEIVRLRSVVAEACFTFPVEAMS